MTSAMFLNPVTKEPKLRRERCVESENVSRKDWPAEGILIK